MRHPARWAASLGLLAVAVAIALVAAAGQTHRGTGVAPGVHAQAGLQPVPLSQTAAHGYNPFGTGPENRDLVQNVVDSDPNTTWSTEQYYDGTLRKQGGVGAGLYLDASPGVVARAIELQTPTPGFAAQIYAANQTPPTLPYGDPTPLSARGWQGPVGTSAYVRSHERIRLAGERPFRYFLIWISALPPNRQSAAISEAVLFR
jgi:serine/threonine-protein kinase